MNFHHYCAYVKNKNKQKKVKTIIAENLMEVKKLLTINSYDVENVDELTFITSEGKFLVTFNVSEYIRFGKIS